ncbi:MAG: hypothetical protein JZU52_01830 [Lamprocystis purpurea]|nr:hypothetical protein [Lamprocystis purpurea]
MPKKPSKTPTPEPAQIKAVERLLRDRDYPRAIERARVLVQRFPDHGGANQLLVDALDLGRDRGAAALAANQWLERRPNSPRALETFFPLAVEGRHLALAYRRTCMPWAGHCGCACIWAMRPAPGRLASPWLRHLPAVPRMLTGSSPRCC